MSQFQTAAPAPDAGSKELAIDLAQVASAPSGASDRRPALRRFLIIALPSCWLAIWTGLLVAGLPDYGRNIAYELNAMTWVQSTTLMLAALLASLVFVRGWLEGRTTWLWALFAFGLVLIAIDDQFYFHERLREGLLSHAPRFLPWSPPGELIPVLVVIGGLLLIRALVKVMSTDLTARWAFICGAVFGALALGVDTIDTQPWSDSTLLAEQTLEEIVEFLAQTLIVLGLCLYAVGHPDASARRGAGCVGYDATTGQCVGD